MDNRVGVNDVKVNPKGPSAGQSTMFLLFDLILGINHATEWARSHLSSSSSSSTTTNTSSSASSSRIEEPWKQDTSPKEDATTTATTSPPLTSHSVMGKFQWEMLQWYTPPPHRMFIEDFVFALNLSGYESIKHYITVQKEKYHQEDEMKASSSIGFAFLSRSRRRANQLNKLEQAYNSALHELSNLRQAHMKVAVLFLNPSSSASSASSSDVSSNKDTEVGTGSTSFKSLLAEALNNTRRTEQQESDSKSFGSKPKSE
jgi:hypothetical protein